MVDAAGSAVIAGLVGAGIFLTRLTPDGELAFRSTALHPGVAPSVAVDGNGSALVYSGGVLKRFDPDGALLSSKTVATWTRSYPGIALDAAGNAYIAGSSSGFSYPTRNTLATCGTELLSVIAPDDTVLQTTDIAAAAAGGAILPITVSRNSIVLLAPSATANFTPSRTGPFAASAGAAFLTQFSAHADARTFQLSCAVNALSFQTGEVAPGEIVALFGEGLGPETGIEGRATLQSPFPTQLGDVKVTVNGAPAPLLWVQDHQINLIAPWGLAGSSAEVCVFNNQAKTNCLTLPTAETSPGVATVDGVHAAALNQDGTINSPANPAPANSIVTIWATGLGPISPPQPDGAIVTPPLPSNNLPSYIEFSTPNIPPGGGGMTTLPEVTYAGPAPFLASGVTQINFRATGHLGDYAVLNASKRSQAFQIY